MTSLKHTRTPANIVIQDLQHNLLHQSKNQGKCSKPNGCNNEPKDLLGSVCRLIWQVLTQNDDQDLHTMIAIIGSQWQALNGATDTGSQRQTMHLGNWPRGQPWQYITECLLYMMHICLLPITTVETGQQPASREAQGQNEQARKRELAYSITTTDTLQYTRTITSTLLLAASLCMHIEPAKVTFE